MMHTFFDAESAEFHRDSVTNSLCFLRFFKKCIRLAFYNNEHLTLW